MDSRNELDRLYGQALAIYGAGGQPPALPSPYSVACRTILDSQDSNRGVLAVLMTLLLKKRLEPDQDIRLHQAQMDGGFSGRGLDTHAVTPFMKDMSFPSMAESGWLTRSLEQSLPYDLDYPGNIRPIRVKEAFLQLVDGAQVQGLPADVLLLHLLIGLIAHRDRNANLRLFRPVDLSVSEAAQKIRRHHGARLQGAARLPVLAMHAVLVILARELDRYRDCRVLPLERHTTADSRTNLIGDIHVLDADETLFEAYEIKHGIPITAGMIQDSFEKLRVTPVRRFYILTTHSRADYSEFDPDVRRIAATHGCQLILNGVDQTLLYYLRLIRETREFIHQYVSNLESDESVSFQLKEAWNRIAQS